MGWSTWTEWPEFVFPKQKRYSGTPTFYITTPSDGARVLKLWKHDANPTQLFENSYLSIYIPIQLQMFNMSKLILYTREYFTIMVHLIKIKLIKIMLIYSFVSLLKFVALSMSGVRLLRRKAPNKSTKYISLRSRIVKCLVYTWSVQPSVMYT